MMTKKIAAVLSSLLLTVVPGVVGEYQCQTIYEIACGTDGLENFCGLIQALELQDELDGQGSLTVFAPINEAISSMDFVTDDEKLREIILFHVHDGALFTDEMECEGEGGSNLLRMASGKDSRTICEKFVPIFQKGGGNSDDNKPRMVVSDIEACNGVVHMVDKVMLPSGFESLAVNITATKSTESSEGAQRQRSIWYVFATLLFFMYQ